MKELLRKHGKEGDNCMINILTFMHGCKGNWVNKAELSLQKFTYMEGAKVKRFAPETISRKARDLAEMGLLQRNEINHTAEYRWPETQEVPRKKEVRIEIINGVRKAILL